MAVVTPLSGLDALVNIVCSFGQCGLGAPHDLTNHCTNNVSDKVIVNLPVAYFNKL